MHKQQEKQTLLSGSSILIMSFFLVGMVVGRMVQAEMFVTGAMTALSGMASFIGLEYMSRKRKAKQIKTEEHLFVSQLESRINKMLTHESSVTTPKMYASSRRNSFQQYVTVAHSSGKQSRSESRSNRQSGAPHIFRNK